jgi:hypothetical protein
VVFELGETSVEGAGYHAIKLRQDVDAELTVWVSEFLPTPDDTVSYKWKDSNEQSHEMYMPPYCLANMEESAANLKEYVRNSQDLSLE